MLRIGDFARLGGVTVRALRHYDEERLLAPARVDEATGYRSYQFDQLGALDRILALRDLGFSLADVRCSPTTAMCARSRSACADRGPGWQRRWSGRHRGSGAWRP